MKAKVFKLKIEKQAFLVEAFEETRAKEYLANKKNVDVSTIIVDKISPDELKLIWSKKLQLFATKEQTSNSAEIKANKDKVTVLYDLERLLKEDNRFLSQYREDVLNNPSNHVRLRYNVDIKNMKASFPWVVCDSINMTLEENQEFGTDSVFKFPTICHAYWYVRKELIRLNIGNIPYKGNPEVTNLEMCDSFIAGFGTPHMNGNNLDVNQKSSRKFPKYLNKNNVNV